MKKLNILKHSKISKFSYRIILGLFCLSALLAVSCDNDHAKTYVPSEVTPILQKVSFSASSAGSEEGITLSDYPKVKLLITTDEAGKAPAHYYLGKKEKTFDSGGTEFTIEGSALSIHLESGTGQGKAYYVRQFYLDAEGKTSYRLSDFVSFKLKDTDDSKSVPFFRWFLMGHIILRWIGVMTHRIGLPHIMPKKPSIAIQKKGLTRLLLRVN